MDRKVGLTYFFVKFKNSGIGYTVARTPMASCDFSTHEYSYDDSDGDFNLTNFALTMEDYNYKVNI